MNKSTVVALKNRDQIIDPVTEVLLSGAQILIQQAVEMACRNGK